MIQRGEVLSFSKYKRKSNRKPSALIMRFFFYSAPLPPKNKKPSNACLQGFVLVHFLFWFTADLLALLKAAF